MSRVVPDATGKPAVPVQLPPRGPSLRARLLLLVAACILPLFLFGFNNAYFDYQTDRAEAGRLALNTARTLALLIQRDLESYLTTLQVLASSHRLQVGDIAGFRARAEAVLAQQSLRAKILLFREDGQEVMNTSSPSDAPLPARRDSTSLRQLFKSAQASVSDIFIGAASGRPIIALEVPVLRPDGTVLYGLALNPTVDPFAEILRRQTFDQDAIVSLIDRRGIIIARTPNDETFIGNPAGTTMLPLLLTQSEGIVETVSKEGVPVVAAFSHVPTFGWSVAIGLPSAKLTAAAARAALVTFGIGTLCLVLGLLFAQRMARRITNPIASLRELTVTLEQDIPTTTVATGLAETDDVARALVAAARLRRAAETATRHAEQERAQAAELLRTVIEAAPSLIYAKDLAGRMVLANDAFLRFHGKTWTDIAGRTDVEFLDHQTEAEATGGNDCQIMASGQAEAYEEQMGKDGHQPRVWLSTKTPFRNPNGEVIGLVGVSVEITERKQVENQLRLMVDELHHRVKNTLATVQSIAFYTLRNSDRAIRRILEARLLALASAHDVLTRERWAGANLIEVMAGSLGPYGGITDGRFHVSGPPLRLQPRAAVALAMGLHELATNALKFGALSAEGGVVRISWAVVKGAVPHLHMTWVERGGPPVTSPVERGFGIRLLERGLAQDLDGAVHITFATEGITCVIDAPLAGITATAEVAVFPRVGHLQRGRE